MPQQATPTPTPTVTPPPPPPPPVPVLNTSVVVAPKSGTVLIKLPGQTTFVPLPAIKNIPNGSEIDARKGHVTLTSIPKAGAPPETAEFWDGLFIVNQKNGVTTVKLSEKLTGCPKGFQSSLASAAAKKPKTRKLWGSGKGKFRTEGKYSAATVRGTVWLVQDTCTTTLTRVKVGRGRRQRLRQEEDDRDQEGQDATRRSPRRRRSELQNSATPSSGVDAVA